MGNQISRDAFSILPADSAYAQSLLAETYTVVRTSGEHQGDWMVTAKPHKCTESSIVPPAAMGLWNYQDGTMRFHMHNGSVSEEPLSRPHGSRPAAEESTRTHACGWRPLGGFWPSRLNGDPEAQRLWTEKLEEFLMCLKKAHEEAFLAEQQAKEAAEAAKRAEAAAAEAAEIAAAEKNTKVHSPLPDPLSARDLSILGMDAFEASEIPTQHGCGYADSDCTWATCYKCEYDKDPARYKQNLQQKKLIMLISAQFHDPSVGERVRGWDAWSLQQVTDEIQTPRDRRRFTDLQIHNKRFRLGYTEPGSELLRFLRVLCNVY